MGLNIKRVEDLDMRQVLDHAPKGESALRLRALMQGAEIEFSRNQPNACVIHIKGKRPVIYLNPDFIEREIENYYDLFTIIFHEMTHIMVGHFIEPKLMAMFDDWFFTHPEGKKIKEFTEELLVHHITHVALPDDEYHDIIERTFRHRGEPLNIFSRRTTEEEVEDPLNWSLYQRIFTTGAYSTREAAYVMRRRLEADESFSLPQPSDNPLDNVSQADGKPSDDKGDGASDGDRQPEENNDEGSEEEREDSDQRRDGGGPEGDEDGDEGEDEGGAGNDENEGDGNGEEKEEGDDDGSDDEAKGDAEEEESRQEDGPRGSRSEADAESLEALIAAMSDMTSDGASPHGVQLATEVRNDIEEHSVTNVQEIKRAVKQVYQEPDFINLVSRVFQKTTGRQLDYSIIPDPRRDKVAGAKMASGMYVPYFRRPVRDVESKFTLYFDISGSQSAYIPMCNELVLRLKPYIADDGLILFSTVLAPMRLLEFAEHVTKGDVKSYSTGGTNFNIVVDDIKRRKLTHVAILTDNDCGLHGEARQETLKHINENGFLLLLLTEDGNKGRGFRPHANQELILEYD